MPRGRPKKAATAATAHSPGEPEILPSPMPRRGRSAGLVSNNEEDPGSSSVEQAEVTPRRRGRPPKQSKAATPRGRGRPPKQPKVEESAAEGPSGEGYEADVSNLTTIGSDMASDGVTAPTTAVNEVDTSNVTTAGSDVATDVVETTTTTKRPRGRLPKNSKSAVPVTVPTVTSVTSKPAGRARGRPPKNASGKTTTSGSKLVADNNEDLEGSDETLAVSFSLDNLVGSYTVECPKIQETWPDDPEDGDVHEYTLDISPANDGEGILAGSFSFSVVAGTLHVALTKSHLESFLHEEEQATTCPPSSQLSDDNEEGAAKTNEPKDGEQHDENENAGNIDADAGQSLKRKATDTIEPVKRGRGRPPKKAKVVHAPVPPPPPPPPKVFFVYRLKADLGYGETTYEPRFGTIQPDDNSGKLLQGTFDIMPIIDERIDFSVTKLNDKPGNESEFGKTSEIVDN